MGESRYVYNPLTYDELRGALAGKVDRYLECISKRGQVVASTEEDEDSGEPCPNLKPSVPVLDSQQVSAIAVLERCKSNYQQKQWDAGAYVLYDANLSEELASSGSIAPPRMHPEDPVGKCLLRAEKTKQSNLACMNNYIGDAYGSEATSAVFWRYEKVSLATTPSSTDDVDACIVFSGPAKREDDSATTLEFRKCSHDYTDTGCVIPHMVWSSSSKNKVPVATLHTVDEVNPEDREETALARFAEARKMAMDALSAMENFTDSNLQVVLFSGEGDALHQIFDCMVLGPMARVDFWDRCVAHAHTHTHTHIIQLSFSFVSQLGFKSACKRTRRRWACVRSCSTRSPSMRPQHPAGTRSRPLQHAGDSRPRRKVRISFRRS